MTYFAGRRHVESRKLRDSGDAAGDQDRRSQMEKREETPLKVAKFIHFLLVY